MKRFFKIIRNIGLGLLLLIGLAYGLSRYVFSDPLPVGETGPKADSLAHEMLKALHYDAFKETQQIKWDFAGGHYYHWFKSEDRCQVTWNDYKVELKLKDYPSSTVYENGQRLQGEQAEKIIQTAIDYFNNDSFWLVAHYKVFDPGTERSLIENPQGNPHLLVTYSSGGSTPGDSYLWELDDQNRPLAFRIWASIIPLKGMRSTWDDLIITKSGAVFPASHRTMGLEMSMGEVEAF